MRSVVGLAVLFIYLLKWVCWCRTNHTKVWCLEAISILQLADSGGHIFSTSLVRSLTESFLKVASNAAQGHRYWTLVWVTARNQHQHLTAHQANLDQWVETLHKDMNEYRRQVKGCLQLSPTVLYAVHAYYVLRHSALCKADYLTAKCAFLFLLHVFTPASSTSASSSHFSQKD